MEQEKIDVRDHKGLVNYFLSNFLHQHPYVVHLADDLRQEGFLGLMRAADLYDPEKGSFSNFAYYHMRAKIQREAISSGVVRGRKRGSLGERPHVTYLEDLEVDEQEDLVHSSGWVDDPTVLEDIGSTEVQRDVEQALDRLPARERVFLCLYYGLGTRQSPRYQPMTYLEIAKKYGLSRARVQQIADKARRRLRLYLRADKEGTTRQLGRLDKE